MYSLDKLTCSQLDMFTGCVKWAKAECDRMQLAGTPQHERDLLEHILPKVKVQELAWNDFMRVVVPAQLLAPEEVVQFILERQKPTSTTQVQPLFFHLSLSITTFTVSAVKMGARQNGSMAILMKINS